MFIIFAISFLRCFIDTWQLGHKFLQILAALLFFPLTFSLSAMSQLRLCLLCEVVKCSAKCAPSLTYGALLFSTDISSWRQVCAKCATSTSS